jgi:hypothetical protein
MFAVVGAEPGVCFLRGTSAYFCDDMSEACGVDITLAWSGASWDLTARYSNTSCNPAGGFAKTWYGVNVVCCDIANSTVEGASIIVRIECDTPPVSPPPPPPASPPPPNPLNPCNDCLACSEGSIVLARSIIQYSLDGTIGPTSSLIMPPAQIEGSGTSEMSDDVCSYSGSISYLDTSDAVQYLEINCEYDFSECGWIFEVFDTGTLATYTDFSNECQTRLTLEVPVTENVAQPCTYFITFETLTAMDLPCGELYFYPFSDTFKMTVEVPYVVPGIPGYYPKILVDLTPKDDDESDPSRYPYYKFSGSNISAGSGCHVTVDLEFLYDVNKLQLVIGYVTEDNAPGGVVSATYLLDPIAECGSEVFNTYTLVLPDDHSIPINLFATYSV